MCHRGILLVRPLHQRVIHFKTGNSAVDLTVCKLTVELGRESPMLMSYRLKVTGSTGKALSCSQFVGAQLVTLGALVQLFPSNVCIWQN